MGNERSKKGLAVRRETLGDAYVDGAMATADDFSRPFQELINEYIWGVGWSEGVLDRRERSLITMAIVGALNRNVELRIHIKAALGNGCTREEIGDALTQLMLYAGAPAGVEAFRIAREAFAELDAEGPDGEGA